MIGSNISVLESCSIRIRYPKRSVTDHRKTKYGHVHNTFDEYIVNEHQKRIGQYKRQVRGSDEMVGIPCQMLNCFCMFSDYVPLTLDEWIELDKKRRQKISISDYEAAEEMDIELESR